MANWVIHLIVPLLALLIVSRREDMKYILLLLPLALVPDLDTLVTLHRALLHNIFIPIILVLSAIIFFERRKMLIIASVYFASHVMLDLFEGGVVLLYPVYNRLAFVDASLSLTPTNAVNWIFDYGFTDYSKDWMNAHGYIFDSVGAGALVFILLAGICVLYRNRFSKKEP
jgi:hypothetical protein